MWLNLSLVESLLSTDFVGRRLIYLTSTVSTQDIARREAEEGAAAGTVVLAEEQTAGRGRFGRTWVSPAGTNLYFTLILQPPLSRLRSLSIVAPLAVARAVRAVSGLDARIKWPNDVLLGGRKFAGVLIETEVAGDAVRYALIGIGVNVNFDVIAAPDIAAIATSLKQEAGQDLPREELLARLLNEFERLYEDSASGANVLDEWKARLETLGRPVSVSFRDQAYEGVAEDVDRDGSLLLRLADGSLVTLEAGEVSLRSPAG